MLTLYRTRLAGSCVVGSNARLPNRPSPLHPPNQTSPLLPSPLCHEVYRRESTLSLNREMPLSPQKGEHSDGATSMASTEHFAETSSTPTTPSVLDSGKSRLTSPDVLRMFRLFPVSPSGLEMKIDGNRGAFDVLFVEESVRNGRRALRNTAGRTCRRGS